MSEKGKKNGVYNEVEYETIAFPMMKGSKAIIKNHCDETNETYHAFLRRAVNSRAGFITKTMSGSRSSLLLRNGSNPARKAHSMAEIYLAQS